MARLLRWDPCIAHRGDEVPIFVDEYFKDPSRKVLFIGGAGFDPRSAIVASLLSSACKNVRAFLIKENRPNPTQGLVKKAEDSRTALASAFSQHEIVSIEIFGADGAVVGGRNVVVALHDQDFGSVTDVVVDVSALSIGTSFPMIKYLVERFDGGGGSTNLHVFVAHEAALDEAIVPIPCDVPGYIHGFRGASTLDRSLGAAKLWLPQLARQRRSTLTRLYSFLEQPHDTCPILPFPASNPRLGDEIASDFLTEFESSWSVDTRNIVYAAEDDPLDLYRTILKLDDLRRPVFEEFGGSLLVLSPVGSKVMALGALMAALERDLPVAYLEAIGYNFADLPESGQPDPFLVHLWLEGDVYPQPRPPLKNDWKTQK
ncbi:hypothetical protein [Paraburkholderia dipogonis]|uniref:hypothetical protein n=1 Tax=Paraburkholderia dipogonis TaxID=1211383 RepID=UPI0038B976A3